MEAVVRVDTLVWMGLSSLSNGNRVSDTGLDVVSFVSSLAKVLKHL